MLFSPSLVYWLSPSFFTGNKFSGPRAPPSHLGPKRSFLHERGEGRSGEQRDVWEGRRRPTPSRRTSIHKCPLPSPSLKLSWRERKRKEKKTDCTVSHTVYSSFVNTYIASSLACNFHELLRKLLWQVKKTGRLRFLLMLIKNREAWHGRDRYALDQEKASWLLRILPALTTCHDVFLNQFILSKKKKKERKKEK